MIAYLGYQIADGLLYGPSVSPLFSEKSALDMFAKNGYLIPVQQQMLNWKWNGPDTGGYNSLPSNAQTAYNAYNAVGWKGQFSGVTPGTGAGWVWENNKQQLPSTDKRSLSRAKQIQREGVEYEE